MAENTEEEYPGNQPDPGSENASDESILPEETKPVNLNHESKTMEVHHHPEVEKKGLKEYLLEGLMIFIAVTMGFFAESLRETISEKRIEKEYIESFVKDLEADTTTFNSIIPKEEISIKGLDTMLRTLSTSPYPDSAVSQMYYLYRKYTTSIEEMSYTLRTITQLKNSGGLRLITNKNASDSMMAYDRKVDDILRLIEYTTNDFMIPSIKMGNKIFYVKFLLPYNSGDSVNILLTSSEKMKLQTSDESVIHEYMGLIYDVKQIRINYLNQLKWHRERAKDMIQFFKKDYHLE